MSYFRYSVLAVLMSCGAASAQEVSPPPFKPGTGVEIPSASIQPRLAPPPKQEQLPPPPPPPAPPVGRVFSLTGEWANAAGQLLGIGSGVAAGEKISVRSAGKSSI